MIRVLHSVGTFLNVSENWIYPTITRVPDVESRVMCSSVRNREVFPIANELFVDPPLWSRAFGIPRFFNAVGRRIGCGGALTRLRARAWRPNLLHGHFGTRGWECLRLKLQIRCPLVTSFYGYDAWLLPHNDTLWCERYRKLFAIGEAFLVEGPAMRRRLCELGCPEKKVIVQRIGVDLDSLSFEPRNFADGLNIIMVARFVEKKGFVDGLRACALARHLGVKLKVTIVGDASAEDAAGNKIKQELQELARGPELAGLVYFAGFLPLHKTRELMKEQNVFLCPSRHASNGDAEGGSPVALTEAMAAGLLCVGTRHCDIPEVILDGETGLLCEEGNSPSLASTLRRAGELGARATDITQTARRHVEKNFSLSGQMRKLRAVYEPLLSPY